MNLLAMLRLLFLSLWISLLVIACSPEKAKNDMLPDVLEEKDSVRFFEKKAFETKKPVGLPGAIMGAMAYHIDDSMHVGEVSFAELKIGLKEETELIEEIKRINRSRDNRVQDADIESRAITIGENMKARLIDPTGGERFKIIQLSATEQKLDLSGQHSTLWQWSITPLKSGIGELVISIDILVDGVPKSFPVYQTRVAIFALNGTISTWWIYVTGTLLVVLLVILTLWFRKKKVHKGNEIFISYRRADSSGFTISLYKDLNQSFRNKVFKDIENIPIGSNFLQEIRSNLEGCSIVIVVIGKQWLSIADKDGNKRLFDENDFVNLEVATALQLGKTVIPVLVDGAVMPSEEELPDNLKQLAFLNAIALPHDNWDASVSKLTKQMKAWI